MPRTSSGKANLAVNMLLLAASLTVTFASLEIYARWKYGRFNMKEKGFYCRGERYELKKERDIYRIVCIGGSTTFGGSEYREAYPYYLERILNDGRSGRRFEVINSGIAAAATEFHRDLVKERIDDGDVDMLVIHSLYNHFGPFYTCGKDPRGQVIFENNKVRIGWQWDRMSFTDKLKVFLTEHSYFYCMFRDYLARFKKLDSNLYLSKKAGYQIKYGECAEHNIDSIKDLDKLLAGFLDRYRKAIEEMIQTAMARRSEVVLVIPPYPFSVDEPGEDPVSFRSGQYYAGVFEKARDVLTSLGRQYGVTVIDADREFLRIGRTPDLFIDFVHLTAKGNRQFADIVAAGINDVVSKKE
ncbi:MAG: SGNH/GDSL hydrolase family protein [Candidatus Omnitrophota bacterium]